MAKNRQFVRSMTDRVFGGVCGGIGAYTGLNAVWIRLLFVIMTPITMGYGLLLYIILWLVMPPETLGDLPGLTPVKVGEAANSAANNEARAPRGSSVGQVIFGVAVMLLGVVFLAVVSGMLPIPPGDLFWPAAALSIGAALIWRQVYGV